MTVFMTPISRMCREKAADLEKALDEETDDRRALAIARIALSWLELAEFEERPFQTICLEDLRLMQSKHNERQLGTHGRN